MHASLSGSIPAANEYVEVIQGKTRNVDGYYWHVILYSIIINTSNNRDFAYIIESQKERE